MSSQKQSLINNAVLSAVSLVGFIILSRGLVPDVFGQWVLFLSISTFFNLIRFGITRPAATTLIPSCNSMSMVHMVNGAALRLNLYILLIASVLCYSLWLVGRNVFNDIYILILLWYPLVGLSGLLWINALTFLDGVGRFAVATSLRLMNAVIFLIIISVMFYFNWLTIDRLIASLIFSNVICSVYSLIRGWASASYFFMANKERVLEILNLGRYTMGETISSSLLKSADSFIISLSPVLGITAVAVYAIPFKIIEMLELPVTSVAKVGFGALSRSFKKRDRRATKFLMTKYAVMMILLIVPVILGIAFFASDVLLLICGAQYISYLPSMTGLLYVLLFYGLMLIPDHLASMAFETMGRAQFNVSKVVIMAICNIVGDLIAVFVFHSLFGVVVATVFFMLVGNLVAFGVMPQQFRPVFGNLKQVFLYRR